MVGKTAAHLGAMFFFICLVVPAWAQDAMTDTGMRRVAVPAPNHAGRRITIQITPEEHLRNTTPPAALSVPLRVMPPVDAPPVASGGTAAWFWSAISPAMPADPGRFWAAQDVLASAPEATHLSVPRLITLQGIVDRHAPAILRASLETQVSPALILAVMAVESAGRVDAVSRAGAQGLMQLIPATAERFGVSDPFDPAQNIAGGTAYLEWLLAEFGGDAVLALAGYNAGEGAVRRAGGVPDYRETRDYVPKVLATWMMARRLCSTPPDLISDGCVFTSAAVN